MLRDHDVMKTRQRYAIRLLYYEQARDLRWNLFQPRRLCQRNFDEGNALQPLAVSLRQPSIRGRGVLDCSGNGSIIFDV